MDLFQKSKKLQPMKFQYKAYEADKAEPPEGEGVAFEGPANIPFQIRKYLMKIEIFRDEPQLMEFAKKQLLTKEYHMKKKLKKYSQDLKDGQNMKPSQPVE